MSRNVESWEAATPNECGEASLDQHDSQDIVDLFVIGGGINGCGIARDAVGRGLTVELAEMNDLASATRLRQPNFSTVVCGTLSIGRSASSAAP